MFAYYNLREKTLALAVSISIVGAISACHSKDAKTQSSPIKFAETVFGPNGLMDAEMTPPSFDGAQILPVETAGAPGK